jgi:hypothetical protein
VRRAELITERLELRDRIHHRTALRDGQSSQFRQRTHIPVHR